MKRLSLCIIVSILLCSCSIFEKRIVGITPQTSAKQEADWNMMCGKWYSKTKTVKNEIREELCEMFQDGTYLLKFKRVDTKGHSEFTIESGEWGISGGILFTITKSINFNGVDEQIDVLSPYHRTAYKIKKLSSSQLIYTHLTMNETYTDSKVNKEFDLKENPM
jgi:hypothetical protein